MRQNNTSAINCTCIFITFSPVYFYFFGIITIGFHFINFAKFRHSPCTSPFSRRHIISRAYVISRAGAITLGEIQACGKAAVLIPSPFVAENHQYHNGMTLKNAGAAELIEEKDLNAQKIIEVVSDLLNDTEKIKSMEKSARENAIIDANERIYKVLMELYSNS